MEGSSDSGCAAGSAPCHDTPVIVTAVGDDSRSGRSMKGLAGELVAVLVGLAIGAVILTLFVRGWSA